MAGKATEGALGAWYEANPLRQFRRVSGITIIEIAEALNVDKSMISRWEIGSHRPKVEAFVEIAELLGKTTGELFDEWATWLSKRPTEAMSST